MDHGWSVFEIDKLSMNSPLACDSLRELSESLVLAAAIIMFCDTVATLFICAQWAHFDDLWRRIIKFANDILQIPHFCFICSWNCIFADIAMIEWYKLSDWRWVCILKEKGFVGNKNHRLTVCCCWMLHSILLAIQVIFIQHMATTNIDIYIASKLWH